MHLPCATSESPSESAARVQVANLMIENQSKTRHNRTAVHSVLEADLTIQYRGMECVRQIEADITGEAGGRARRCGSVGARMGRVITGSAARPRRGCVSGGAVGPAPDLWTSPCPPIYCIAVQRS